jgi:hypothetical protein
MGDVVGEDCAGGKLVGEATAVASGFGEIVGEAMAVGSKVGELVGAARVGVGVAVAAELVGRKTAVGWVSLHAAPKIAKPMMRKWRILKDIECSCK